jgi:hypothetical protein
MPEPKIRSIFHSKEFEDFLDSLDSRVREKYIWTMKAVETLPVIPSKYVKK